MKGDRVASRYAKSLIDLGEETKKIGRAHV